VNAGEEVRDQDGQVLVLVALFIVVLLGFAALVIDIGGAYAAERHYRSVADAAALAGAQDLQQPGLRTVEDGDRVRARQHAMQTVISALGITGTLSSACSTATNVDVTDACILPDTTFHVSIRTPVAPGGCETCDPERSVQVGVRNATFPVSIGRLFGQTSWNVGVTSVAGMAYGRSYAIVTLRPPKKLGSTFDVRAITLDGGTVVNVSAGDVGSNANMDYAGTSSGTIMNLDSGYRMYYYPAAPPDDNPGWLPYPPVGEANTTLIRDPMYRYPDMTGAPIFEDARASEYLTLEAVERADTDATCAAEAAKVNPSRYAFMATQPLDTIYCYKPGIYQSGHGAANATITVGTGDVALLETGAYYLQSGLDVGGRIIGGYEPGKPGVALMFDEAGPGNCSTCVFNGNSALTIALNAGTRFPPTFNGGTPATAAIDWAGQPVQTSGADGPKEPVLITLLVRKDPGCYVPTSAPFIEPAACDAGKDKTLNMAGGGSLALEGVQYAPTDNVQINGGSTGNGRVGQIIAWTLFYSGGTRINQEGVATEGPGTVRLDAACTAPGTPCVP
jgi:hypothetical protein